MKGPKRRNQKDVERLLDLLGPASVDDDSVAPATFTEAIMLHGVVGRPRERGPCGKVVYPSEKAAQASIHHLLKGGKANTSRLRSYLCTKCAGWHITSTFHGP